MKSRIGPPSILVPLALDSEVPVLSEPAHLAHRIFFPLLAGMECPSLPPAGSLNMSSEVSSSYAPSPSHPHEASAAPAVHVRRPPTGGMRFSAAAASESALATEPSDVRRSIESQGLMTAAAHAAAAPRTGAPPAVDAVAFNTLNASYMRHLPSEVSSTPT